MHKSQILHVFGIEKMIFSKITGAEEKTTCRSKPPVAKKLNDATAPNESLNEDQSSVRDDSSDTREMYVVYEDDENNESLTYKKNNVQSKSKAQTERSTSPIRKQPDGKFYIFFSFMKTNI